jgi:hypothetical protein
LSATVITASFPPNTATDRRRAGLERHFRRVYQYRRGFAGVGFRSDHSIDVGLRHGQWQRPGNWTGWYIDTIAISSCASFTCWNLAPVLPAQSTLTNNELTLLDGDQHGDGTEQHATTTGYTLVSPPAGATISTNGIITWTPSQTQSHTTNFTITTVVTNSDPSDSVNPH